MFPRETCYLPCSQSTTSILENIMKTRQAIGLSVLSSLLTVLAVLIVFSSGAIAIAQKISPTPTPVKPGVPLNPDALAANAATVHPSAAPELPNAVNAATD